MQFDFNVLPLNKHELAKQATNQFSFQVDLDVNENRC